MARRPSCDRDSIASIARDLDCAFGPVNGDGPYFFFLQPGRVLLEVPIEEPYQWLATVEVPPATVAIGLVIEGWGAPNSSDPDALRPSQHPERVRIRTTMVIGRRGEHTVMRYAGDDEAIALGDSIAGELADAMRRCWRRAVVRAG
jgi:hypothetical protein